MPRSNPESSIEKVFDFQTEEYINRPRVTFAPGTVVYFAGCQKMPWYVKRRKTVLYGIAIENYTDGVILQMIEPKDTRKINGVPIKDYPAASEWRKLPKNWTWNTNLLPPVTGNINAFMDSELIADGKVPLGKSVDDPADILELYRAGLLVNVQENDHCCLQAEVDKRYGYRIVKNYDLSEQSWSPFVTVPWRDAHDTWAGAQAVVDAEEAELKRQSELTDLEWSVEQIERDISRWARLYSKTDLEKERLREWMMALKNLEDVETRVANGSFEWKYFNHKRWGKPDVI